MTALTKALSPLVVLVACVLALATASPASANTGDGGGGAPFTLYTNNFTAYGCTHYATNQHITYYNCTGGVRSGGYFYSGTKCARHNYGWGWYGSHCRNYV